MRNKIYKGGLFVSVLMIAGVILFSWTCATAAQPKQVKPEITIKCSHSFSQGSSSVKGWMWWADQVTKRTDGRIQFKWYHGGALSKPGEEQEHMRTGFADMVMSSATFHAHMKLWEMNGAIPFQPKDTSIAVKTKWQLYNEFKELQDEIALKNGVLMFIGAYGDYQIISRVPLKSMDDLKGLKLAVLGRQQPKWISPVGAIPTTIPGPARYEALEKGVVDASLMTLVASYAFRHHEICKYFLYADLGQYCSIYFTMNKDTWNKISREDQKVIQDISMEVMNDFYPKLIAEEDVRVEKLMKEAGVTFYSLTDKEKARWAESLPNLAQDWINEATDASGKELRKRIWKRYLEITAGYGFTWPMDWSKVD